MAITFNTNLAALGAQRNIGIASNAASSSLSKLSSGSRVPQAKDDAAGLAIGSKLKSEVAGLTQASNNAAQAISLLQIADGALSTIGDVLQRMKALAVQSSSGQLADSDRSLLNQEFVNLRSEVDRVAGLTNFNGNKLLSGSDTVAVNFSNLTGVADAVEGKGMAFTLSDDFGNGAVKVDYTASSKALKLTNLATGVSQTLTVENGTIATGETELYNFKDLGIKVTLDSTFSKTTDIALTNTAMTHAGVGVSSAAAVAASTAVTGTTGTATLAVGNFQLNGVGADALKQYQIVGNTTVGGTAAATTFTNITIGTHIFSAAAVDLSGAPGAKVVSFSDGVGNSFDLTLTTAAAYTGPTVGALRFTQDNTGTGYTATNNLTGTGGVIAGISVVDVAFNGTGANLIDQKLAGTVTVTTGTQSAAVLQIVVDGKTLVGAATDLSTIGTKNIRFADANGNSMTLAIELTTAYTGVIAGNIAITAGSTGGVIDNTTTRPAITKITADATNPVKFGDLTDANVRIVAGAAGATTVSMTIAGVAFSSANTGGSAALTNTTGLKTAKMTDGNGNSIEITYDVDTALTVGDQANVNLTELGQTIGADSTHIALKNFDFKVGTGTSVNDSIQFAVSSSQTEDLGIEAALIDTAASANAAINSVNAAITGVSSRRADLGAAQSRLDFASNSISVAIENTSAAASALLDVDVSAEITKFTNQNVLMQAGISLLGQANQQPALLLRLLQ